MNSRLYPLVEHSRFCSRACAMHFKSKDDRTSILLVGAEARGVEVRSDEVSRVEARRIGAHRTEACGAEVRRAEVRRVGAQGWNALTRNSCEPRHIRHTQGYICSELLSMTHLTYRFNCNKLLCRNSFWAPYLYIETARASRLSYNCCASKRPLC